MTSVDDPSGDGSATLETARRWAAADPDIGTRGPINALIDRAERSGDPSAMDRLEALFRTRLSFGTAGIRGSLGPGPAHMNRLQCRQVAAGIARTLLSEVPDASSRGVVLGRDARHGSRQFSADVAEVLCAHGLDVHVIDGVAPTPLAAFAARHIAAAGAVVITASHNPPADNGIKVYWSDGAQIVPPIDQRISDAIRHVSDHGHTAPEGVEPGGRIPLGPVARGTPIVEAYLAEASALVGPAPQEPPIVAVTSLHGVGADLLEMTLRHNGYTRIHPVATQRDPDPGFPTLELPNPEEPGAMDAVVDLAERVGASIAIANDPDADRVALAVPSREGPWRILSGDETGALLAAHLIASTEGVPERLVATTVVSSRLLAAIARSAGVHFAETLTGFKWLCRPALENPSWHQVLTYEEALGYAIGPRARDKDGITAALVAVELIHGLEHSGLTAWDVLDDLARAHGAHVTANGSVRLTGDDPESRRSELTRRIARVPPSRLGGTDVTSVDQPAEDVLRLWLADDTRVVLRPSGTEPKFKYYCEAIEPVTVDGGPDGARAVAAERLARITTELRTLLET